MLMLASRAFRSRILQASSSTSCLQSSYVPDLQMEGVHRAISASQLQQQRWMAVPKRKVLAQFLTISRQQSLLITHRQCLIDGFMYNVMLQFQALDAMQTSPHRRGMRNANKYLRRVNAASKCGYSPILSIPTASYLDKHMTP